MKRSLFSIFMVAVLSLAAFAQQNSGAAHASAMQPRIVPMEFLYRHFFAHVAQLEQEANSADRAGQNGTAYRNYYQKQLGFSDIEFSRVRSTALETHNEVEQIDAKARDIVRAFREQLAGREILGQAALPPPPTELKELKKERDALVSAAIGKLKTSLGTDAAARLDSMVAAKFTVQEKPQTALAQTAEHTPNLSAPALERVPRLPDSKQ